MSVICRLKYHLSLLLVDTDVRKPVSEKAACPFPSGVRWWMKKGWGQVLVRVNALCSLQRFDTEWLEGYPFRENPVPLMPRGSLLEQTEEDDPGEKWLIQVNLEKWPLNESNNSIVSILMGTVWQWEPQQAQSKEDNHTGTAHIYGTWRAWYLRGTRKQTGDYAWPDVLSTAWEELSFK